MKLKGIDFRPDKALRTQMGNLKVNPLKQHDPLRKNLTDKEINKSLENDFSTNDFMTRSDFQSLCGMARSTATRYIHRLCEEGKLENRGV